VVVLHVGRVRRRIVRGGLATIGGAFRCWNMVKARATKGSTMSVNAFLPARWPPAPALMERDFHVGLLLSPTPGIARCGTPTRARLSSILMVALT
jgi:hypothetical protein